MDLNTPLGVVERVQGTRALVSYVIGAAIGAAVALPIIAALFGLRLPIP